MVAITGKTNKVAARNLIILSDTHFGCQMALCPPDGAELDGGGVYKPSRLQLKLWAMWEHAWNEWVPRVTKGEPYCVVHNGDVIDGSHHNSTTQISHNIEDQLRLAQKVMRPIVEKCDGRYWHIRGTDAHVGQSGEDEETLARSLNAKKDKEGRHARFELWKRMPGYGLVHFAHHIGTVSSSAYESTAVYKELVEAYVEAGRWGDEPPQVVVRSHRHRNFETRIACNVHKDGKRTRVNDVDEEGGYAIAMVTAAWQLKTPFAYRIAGARQTQPQIGLSIIRAGDEELHARHKVWRIERPQEE